MNLCTDVRYLIGNYAKITCQRWLGLGRCSWFLGQSNQPSKVLLGIGSNSSLFCLLHQLLVELTASLDLDLLQASMGVHNKLMEGLDLCLVCSEVILLIHKYVDTAVYPCILSPAS